MASRMIAEPLRLAHEFPCHPGGGARRVRDGPLRPGAVEFAELHDAFTPFELIALEDIGLVPPGKAARVTLDGDTALDGRLPINTSGGLKARGHPLAATRLAQIAECVWQLTGGAQGRQLDKRVGLAHSIGGLATNNWVTVLEAR
jgi:acetyl-CoA C-acetyltransferase